MALWTPYSEALDLSKTASAINAIEERPLIVPEVFPPRYQYCHLPDLVRQYPLIPAPQISPEVSQWYTKSVTPPESPEYETESLLDDVEYQAFERDALRAMAERNGGSLLGNNPRMRRAVQGSAGEDGDESYRRQRARNNHAAKQSRDRRKLREVRLAFQVTFLNKKLAALRATLGSRVCSKCQQKCLC